MGVVELGSRIVLEVVVGVPSFAMLCMIVCNRWNF